MASTSPDNIFSPDAGSSYALTTDLAAMAGSMQTALIKRSWYYLGTDAQRLALSGAELRNGIIFEDISTGEIWQYRAGAWTQKELVRNIARINPVTSDNQTGITTSQVKLTGTDLAFTLSAPTLLRLYASFVTLSTSASDVCNIRIKDGSTTEIYSMTQSVNSSPTDRETGKVQVICTEAMVPAGAHNFNVTIQRVVGGGTVSVTPGLKSPTSFSIDRIG